MNFDNVIGNDNIKELLNNSIKLNNVVHSYMFIGPDGIGKSIFSKDFAKMLLCMSKQKSCNNCSSCIKFNSNNHPDFVVINSDDGKSIKINQIRIMQEQIAEKPIISSRKVYVINDSDLMTVEAQNCLLKNLEEPPEYAIIILVLSNENKLLNTIKSRCTKITFHKLTNEQLLLFSKNNNISVDNDLFNTCDGSISNLLKLQSNSNLYNSLNLILNDFNYKDIVDIWNEADVLYNSKDNIYDLLEYINDVFFNKLRITNDEKYINSIKIVENTRKKLLSNANFDMCIDNLLLKIWEEFNEGNNRSQI